MNKEAIKLLTKDVAFWDNDGGKIAQIPRDDYDQALAILSEQPEPSKGNKEAIKLLEEALDYKGDYAYVFMCKKINLALLIEQPPAGGFTKELRRKLSDSCCAIIEDLPGWRSMVAEARVMSFEACYRLDSSEAGERILEERIEKLSDTLDRSKASRKKLLTACRQAFNESHNPKVEKILQAAIKTNKENAEKKRGNYANFNTGKSKRSTTKSLARKGNRPSD